MKSDYTLKYRTGWGENCEVTFHARYVLEAQRMAKNYCIHNFISIAWLYTESGKCILI